MRTRTLLPLAAALAGLGLSACGQAGSRAASRAAPPAPIVLSALVGSRGVSVSPVRLGAGPVLVTATNQGPRAVVLTLARRGRGHALAHTAPIPPQGVVQLKTILARGTYLLSVRGPRAHTDAARSRAPGGPSAVLHVGRSRPSSGTQVLSP